MLMDDPRDLARMPREVAGEPRRNQQIDRLPVARREIEQAPCRRLREQRRLRLRPKRDGDLLHLVAAALKLLDQRLYVQLRSPAHERHLRFRDDDSPDRVHRPSPATNHGVTETRSHERLDLRNSVSPWFVI